MKVTYFLKDSKSKEDTPLYALINFSGNLFKYYINTKINPKNWIQADQRVRKSMPGHSDLNNFLETRKSQIKSIYHNFITTQRKEPSKIEFKQNLDNEFKDLTKTNELSHTFSSIFKEFINKSEKGIRVSNHGKPISASTIKVYKSVENNVHDFLKSCFKKELKLEDVNLEFYSKFTEYLTTTKQHSTNTIGNQIKTIKAVMNYATEIGINTNLKYMQKAFKKISEISENIYLTENELYEMLNLDLVNNKRLSKVRDLFLIGAFTGQRVSDWHKINPNLIIDGLIEIETEKTRQKIKIPIHPILQILFQNYTNGIPSPPSPQKINEYLKEIGQKIPSLKSKIQIKQTFGGKELTREFEKWEKLTTHTARRSFATNEYKKGTPSRMIRAITGHTTEKSFASYIKVTQDEEAKQLLKIWNER